MNKATVTIGLGVALGCLASVPIVVPRLRPHKSAVADVTDGRQGKGLPGRVGASEADDRRMY